MSNSYTSCPVVMRNSIAFGSFIGFTSILIDIYFSCYQIYTVKIFMNDFIIKISTCLQYFFL